MKIQINNLTYNLHHKETKKIVSLARQQTVCFLKVMQGKSAKEIAIDMDLSHRTVQHYLARIRQILGCSTSKELIVCYYSQVVATPIPIA